MIELKIQQLGNGLGVQLPQEVVEQLHLGVGDSISLEKISHGYYRLLSQSQKSAEQITLIESYMHEEDA